MSPPSTFTPTNLASRFDSAVTPPTREQSTTESFSELVSKVLHQVAPTFDYNIIKSDLATFFSENHISNEDGLGEFAEDSHLPPSPTTETACMWKVPLLRKGFLTICKCCATHYIDSSTTFKDCKQSISLSATTSLPTTSVSAPTSDSDYKYSIKTVSTVTLESFSGKFGTYKDWADSVILAYGGCGHKAFLTDQSLCEQHEEISNSIKCTLAQALLSGNASYLSTDPKVQEMTNAAKFWELIKEKYDIKADRDCREFHHWNELMDLRLEDRDQCDAFINHYETTLSYLKHSESVAIGDKNLMRSMIIRSIKCDDFDDLVLDAVDNHELDVNKIISKLRSKAIAFESKTELSGSSGAASSTTSILKTRRGNVSSSSNDNSMTKNTRIPQFPPELRSVVTKEVWQTLCLWRALHNKPILEPGEREKLKNLTFASSSQSNDNNTNNQRSNNRRGNRSRNGNNNNSNNRNNNNYNHRDNDSFHRDRSRSRSASPGRDYGRSSRSGRYDEDYRRRSRRTSYDDYPSFHGSDYDRDYHYRDRDYSPDSIRARRAHYYNLDSRGSSDSSRDRQVSFGYPNNDQRNSSSNNQSAKSILTNGRNRG